MTRNKSFKQRVRARMDRTGESYSAARVHLLPRAESAPASASVTHADTASEGVRAGAEHTASTAAMNTRVPDGSVRERTGRDYAGWSALLDAWGAPGRTHTEIAAWLVREHDVPGWWAQTVTVAYEQARGLRVPGQKKDGFAVSASKTVDVPVERLFAAFTKEAWCERWLPGSDLSVRTATEPQRLTADFDHASRLTVRFTAKGEDKAVVASEHSKLADDEAAGAAKVFWRQRLARLKDLLEQEGA
ncbi:SRPBCC family protein [Nocardiopsis quinghaiensis]|uniref:SRPBCC domain-containing protein n=1 Tax=Nocardiopsis quinghaiensis TaxID=464995 RepID=UPI00123B93A2|nr:SRPBCC domain-containing protein [Nocardiopsis quinghaiensis]